MASMHSLSALFENELRDVYDAERQIVRALPKMIQAASNEDLQEALESHLEETRGHVDRLEQAFGVLEMKPRGKHCAGMAGILEEGKDLMNEDGADAVLDAGFIAAAQRVEHYEIGAYGTLMAWAKLLGHDEIIELFEQTLEEEKAADQKLTAIAESSVNGSAASAADEEEDEEEAEEAVGPKGRARAGASIRR